MKQYLLWTRSSTAMPNAAIIFNYGGSPRLNEYERRHKIGEALLISPEHDSKKLDELKILYPCPAIGEDK